MVEWVRDVFARSRGRTNVVTFRQVFPYAVAIFRAPTANGALAKLMEARKKRLALQAIGANPRG